MLKKTVFCLLALILLLSATGCDDRVSDPTIDVPYTSSDSGGSKVSGTRLPDKYSVRVDLFSLPEAVTDITDRDTLALYRDAVSAFLAFETEVEVGEGRDPYRVTELLCDYCPVIFCDTAASGPAVDPESGNILFTYTSETKEVHDSAVEAFVNKAEGLLEDLDTDYSDTLVSMLIYNRYITSVSTNIAADSGRSASSGYIALMAGTGGEESVTRGLSFLYTQAGINNLCVSSAAGHLLASAIDGGWYYLCPAADSTDDTFTNFGMSEALCAERGYTETVCAYSGTPASQLFTADSDTFSCFSNGAESIVFEIDKNLMSYVDAYLQKWNFYF